jgi:hypothetical protein
MQNGDDRRSSDIALFLEHNIGNSASVHSGAQIRSQESIKNGVNTPPKSQFFSSIRPLLTPPAPPKGTPVTINARDIEQYVQPLYARRWRLFFSQILSNGNGIIAVSRKRFEFGNPEALERFLADLSEYGRKKKVRPFSFHLNVSTFHLSCPLSGRDCLFADCQCFEHHAKTSVFK